MPEIKIRKGKKNNITRIRKTSVLKPKGANTLKYCGIIKLKEDPLLIQKKLRNEWG
ncbi:MAG TPA: hypothetical protein VMU83_12600 [Hanamia sp.]|nr:hypothetical protein [Hanamia sp.]